MGFGNSLCYLDSCPWKCEGQSIFGVHNSICCGCLFWFNESDGQHGFSSLYRHSEEGNRKCTQHSVTLGPYQRLWLGGSRDNKLRSSELCCLSSVSRGTVPALFLFPPVRRFPEMLLASQNSSRNSAQRLAMRQTASCLQAHAVSGMLEAPLSSFALA